MAATAPKLYVQPASHPCAAVEAALALKSIAYEGVDLLPTSQLLVGSLRYSGTTVPAMRIGDERPNAAEPMHTLDSRSPTKHVDRLYRAAWALCGSREDAEDLVRETFARVLARPRVVQGDDD